DCGESTRKIYLSNTMIVRFQRHIVREIHIDPCTHADSDDLVELTRLRSVAVAAVEFVSVTNNGSQDSGRIDFANPSTKDVAIHRIVGRVGKIQVTGRIDSYAPGKDKRTIDCLSAVL